MDPHSWVHSGGVSSAISRPTATHHSSLNVPQDQGARHRHVRQRQRGARLNHKATCAPSWCLGQRWIATDTHVLIGLNCQVHADALILGHNMVISSSSDFRTVLRDPFHAVLSMATCSALRLPFRKSCRSTLMTPPTA